MAVMYVKRAMYRFKRYYFHGLRNGNDSETAAHEAMEKTKNEMLEMLHKDRKLNELDRQEMWGDCLAALIEWEMLLVNVPIDTARLLSAGATNINENPDKPPDDGVGDE